MNGSFLGRKILVTLVKQARCLNAFKLARIVYETLRTLRIPEQFVAEVDMGNVTIRAKPFSDAEVSHYPLAPCSLSSQSNLRNGNERTTIMILLLTSCLDSRLRICFLSATDVLRRAP